MAADGHVNLCDWCLHDNKNITASQYCFECTHKLCSVCVTSHGKCKPLINHKLTNIEGRDFNVESIELVRKLQQCPNHPLEIVKYVCKVHEEVCCNECAIVTHRKCDHLVPLSEECIKRKTESVSATLNSLIELDAQANSLLSHEKNNQDVISKSKERVIKELAAVKNDLYNAYKTLERKVLLAVDNRSKFHLNESASSCSKIEQLLDTILSTKFKAQLVADNGDAVLCYLFDRHQRKHIGAFHSNICELVEKTKSRDIQLDQLKSVSEICETITDSLKIKDVISSPTFSFGQSSACDEVIEGEDVSQISYRNRKPQIAVFPKKKQSTDAGRKTKIVRSLIKPPREVQIFDPTGTRDAQEFVLALKKMFSDFDVTRLSDYDVQDENVPLIVVCPHVSLLQLDVDLATQSLYRSSPYVVIIIHIGSEQNLPAISSRQELRKYKNVIFIDMGFNDAIFKCHLNTEALDQLISYIDGFNVI